MSQNRITTFDGLRGIAVLCVVLRHCFSITPGINSQFPGELFRYGWLGVDLFFIISGFVISFTLYKYNNIKGFAIARFARLYPTYWCSIVFYAILVLLVHDHINVSQYLINFLMFQDWLHFKDICGVYWTLAFELAFYVIAATIFYFGYFSKHQFFMLWISIAITWQLSYFLGFSHTHSVTSKLGYIFVLPYAQLFIFGIYLYKAFSTGWSRSTVFILSIAAISYVILAPGHETLSLIIFKLFVSAIFLLSAYATRFPQDKYLSSRFLVFFGKISYSWYLTHLMIAEFIVGTFPNFIWSAPYASLLISFLVAILFKKYIENPTHNFVMKNALAD